jgi:hypothetical protein
MSDNDIRKGFQSKLSGFEAPVPPDGWESVERSLNAAARTVLRRRWYAGVAAAAVLVLLVGGRLFMHNPAERTERLPSASIAMTPLTDSGAEEPMTGLEEFPSEPDVLPADAERLPAARTGAGKEPSVRPSASGGILTAWMERKKLQTKRTDEIDDNALRLLAKSKEEQHRRELYAEEVILVGGDDEMLFAGIHDGRGEGTLLLSVNGRGGLTGYQRTVNTPMTLRGANALPEQSEIDKSPTLAANTAGNISEMEHDMPASFGITIAKYLTDDLSLETGLIYSYLHSKTRYANNNFRIEEVQKLHYLGVPLNVNYTIFSLKRLNVYASVGGMVEKDIYGEFRKVREGQAVSINNGSEESGEYEITKISQRNLQISVNAGVGLSFPLYDRLRLYGKVGGAYYFDAKNRHKTIYSDRKIVMDLNVGLRYEF